MILNQDTAREFLTADDAANYRFFMTGTLITHIHKSLDGISEKIHEMRDTIKNKTAGMKELREELGLMAARLQQMASLESLQDKVNALKFEMAWAQVDEREKDRDKVLAAAEKLEKEAGKEDKKIQDLECQVSNPEKLIQEATENKLAHEREREATKAEIKVLTDQRKVFDREIAQHKQDLDEAAKNIRGQQEQLKSLHVHLDDERRKNAANTGYELSFQKKFTHSLFKEIYFVSFPRDKREQAEKDLQQKEKHVQYLESRWEDLKLRKEPLEAEVDTLNSEFTSVNERVGSLKGTSPRFEFFFFFLFIYLFYHTNGQFSIAEKESEEELYASLMRRKEDVLASFGHNVPRLKQLIAQNQTKFKGRCIGPMGHFVRLRDAKYATAVDAVIGNLLSYFVINDWRDMDLIKRLIRESNGTNSIIMRESWSCPDTTSREPDKARFTTVLNLLDISEPVVAAILIDFRDIEQTIVLPDFESASRVIYSERPQRVNCAFIPDGAKIQLSSGGSRTFMYFSGKKNGGNIFSDVHAEIKCAFTLSSSLLLSNFLFPLFPRTSLEKKRSLDIEYQQKKTDQERLKRTQTEKENELRQLGVDCSKAERDYSRQSVDFKEAREAFEQYAPANLAAIEDQMKEAEGELDLMQRQYKGLSERIADTQQRRAPKVQEVTRLQERIAALQKMEFDLKEAMDEELKVKGEKESHLATAKKKRRDLQEKINIRRDEVGILEADVQTMILQAQVVSRDRVPVTKSPKQLDAELKKLSQSLGAKVAE